MKFWTKLKIIFSLKLAQRYSITLHFYSKANLINNNNSINFTLMKDSHISSHFLIFSLDGNGHNI